MAEEEQWNTFETAVIAKLDQLTCAQLRALYPVEATAAESARMLQVGSARPGCRGTGAPAGRYHRRRADPGTVRPTLLTGAAAETDALLSGAFEELQPSYPGLTKRAGPHNWLFERAGW